MTPQQINEAIAASVGWTKVEQMGPVVVGSRVDEMQQRHLVYEPRLLASWQTPDGKDWRMHIPNYYNDLNAMHEVEKTLTGREQFVYMIDLKTVVYANSLNNNMSVEFQLHHATAAQRAEAYLKVKGLWK
jgi:hypothetical protein